MAPFKNAIERGKLKSELKRYYGPPFKVTENGTTVYKASVGYMKVLNDSGHILLKNYKYSWNDANEIVIDGGEEGKCVVTAKVVGDRQF